MRFCRCPQCRRDATADQFDGGHQFCLREGGHVHLEIYPGDAAQSLAVLEYFPGNLIRTSHHERTMRSQKSVKVGARDRGPTAFPADFRERPGVTGKEIFHRLFGRGGHITKRMNPHLELRGTENQPAGQPPDKDPPRGETAGSPRR